MSLEPPTVVSQNEITLNVREIEPLLQAPPMDVMPWPGADDNAKGRPDNVHPGGHPSGGSRDDGVYEACHGARS